ncbi:MAG: Stk1 family PASTA domain-containing Ser/Thr kinase [Candidatus Velthaea sp.]
MAPDSDKAALNNRYRVEHRLGNGGMAIVFSGTDTLLRRRVAIKVLREQYAADDDFIKRFSYEAQAAAKLSHPNIVNVYDFGSEDHAYFIVMELVDGETLGDLIASAHTIPEPVAIEYAIQIASGLAYAHRQGLLHRDIKPANILVTKDDVVKISDFGIARAVSENTMGVTQPGMVMGSVYYLSPEQAQGFDIDETSDLYAVGVVLYQMLTGALPFSGDTPVAVALKHVSEPAPRIDTAGTGISPALASIVDRLLQKNPRDRFRSATDLASALREARERPSVAQTIAAGSARVEDATRTIPTVTPPLPPPRRSAAPDRPPHDESRPSRVVEIMDARAPAAAPMRWILLALLLIAAVAGGYFLIEHPVFGPRKTIAVGDYTSQSSSQAQQALIALGLHPKVSEEANANVPPDRVIRQNPPAGTKLGADDPVELFVSSGAPLTDVPDVKGYTRSDAERVLSGAKLRTKVIEKYGPAPKDQVVGVAPAAGAKARIGSLITLTVSKGIEPVAVPNVVSLTFEAARERLAAAGLKVGDVQKIESDAIPENTVASQTPQDGTKLDRGATVALSVSTGAAAATIPDVGGKSPEDAAAQLRTAGFNPVITYSVDPSNASGNVTAQQPAPGTSAKRGMKIVMVISVAGTVPDVSGMSLDEAKKTILANGYQIGNVAITQDGDDGKVVRTEPEANKQTRPGESVVIYYHPASGQ